MEVVFLKILNLSISAGWLILAIAIVRFLFPRMPKRILCWIWGLVALRLICPVFPSSALSLIPNAEPFPKEIIYTASPEIQSGIEAVDNVVNPFLQSHMTPAIGDSANPTQIWSFIFTQVWILGVVVMLIFSAVSWILLKRRVSTAIPVRQNIKRCESIDSPFVMGILFPKIYLPSHLEKKDWEYVLSHEEAHIHRKDHLWKPLGFFLLSIYWFHPLMWLAYHLFCQDMEAACDEAVIRNMDDKSLRGYSTALLKISVSKHFLNASPLAFGETGIKKRIQTVMEYRKPAFWCKLLSAAVLIFLIVAFLTNPVKQYDPNRVYPQCVLPEPDSILVQVTGTDLRYEKGSNVYRAIVDSIRQNWWKFTADGAITAPDDALVAPVAPEVLKTKSWRTYVEIDDNIVCFQYFSEPLIWENADGETLSIKTVGFVLPEKTWSEDNTKGFFLISQTDQIGINEGIYTYYYPPEIANDFWGFVKDSK